MVLAGGPPGGCSQAAEDALPGGPLTWPLPLAPRLPGLLSGGPGAPRLCTWAEASLPPAPVGAAREEARRGHRPGGWTVSGVRAGRRGGGGAGPCGAFARSEGPGVTQRWAWPDPDVPWAARWGL